MDAASVLALGLGVTPPWRLAGQRLDTDKKPHVLEISLEAERGAAFPCPDCGTPCKTHDFKTFTWRHLNFFQHHCMITARVPRTVCPEHGVKRATVPRAREGSGFTLLFEPAAMVLVRQMPVLAAARIIAITDKRFWRIVEHYVAKALEGFVLSASRRLPSTRGRPRKDTTTSPCSSTRIARPNRWCLPRRARARWRNSGRSSRRTAASRGGSSSWSATYRRPSSPRSARNFRPPP